VPLATYVTLQGITLSFFALSLPAIIVQITNWERVVSDPIRWGLRWGHFYFYVSEQSWHTALTLLGRTGALNSCLLLIVFTLPVTELVGLLRTCGCPELLTDLALLMYRFVFILMANLRELLTAQKVRGGYGGSWRKTLQSISLAASQLLVRSLSQLREFSLALECRGYDGSFRVYWPPNSYQSFCWRYGLEALVGYGLLLGLTGWHYGTQG
jgi:cobalt/nickel transport system permease protein